MKSHWLARVQRRRAHKAWERRQGEQDGPEEQGGAGVLMM